MIVDEAVILSAGRMAAFCLERHMNLLVRTSLIVVMLGLFGCSRSADPELEKERILNAPKTRKEAVVLMQSVDLESQTRGWNQSVARQFRRRMKGRLISAGMKEKEVDKWVESQVLINRNICEKVRQK